MTVDRKRRAQAQRRRDLGPSGEGKYIVARPPVSDKERAEVRDIVNSGVLIMKNAAMRGELTEVLNGLALELEIPF